MRYYGYHLLYHVSFISFKAHSRELSARIVSDGKVKPMASDVVN